MYRIAIIGGGAAGMMCAARVIESDSSAEVVIFERNDKLGAKVLISGGGRCNVTTGVCNEEELMSYYTRGAHFLTRAFSDFGPCNIRTWFENRGVQCKEEDDRRIFPVSNDGHDIVGVFERIFRGSKRVHIRLRAGIATIKNSSKYFTLILDDGHQERFDAVVITTGGNAYAHTGSRGDGYTFARALGHTVTPCGPSLSSFEVEEMWIKTLSGVTLKNAKLTVVGAEKKQVTVSGGFLFAHFGVTGPVVFALSSHLAFSDIVPAKKKSVRLIPDVMRDAHAWDKTIREACDTYGKRQIGSILTEYLPKRFIAVVCDQCDVTVTQKAAEIGKKTRQKIAAMLGNGIIFHITNRRPGDEFVTAGGVFLDEINPATGQSRITKDLYFAGEVLDIDGLTGGFNLTSSWSVGRLVGNALAKK